MSSLIFDLLLLGVVKLFTPKKQYPTVTRRTTSMEPLAFDSMHEHNKLRAKDGGNQVKYHEPSGDIHRDIVDEDGPNW